MDNIDNEKLKKIQDQLKSDTNIDFSQWSLQQLKNLYKDSQIP